MTLNNARLSRRALWAIILLYLVPGLFGRAPWKPDDSIGFGASYSLMQTEWNHWSFLTIGDRLHASEGLISSWLYALIGLGAQAIGLPHEWLDDAMRLGNLGWLILAGWAIWNATYYLARRSEVQPEDPFGIAPSRIDYARAVADASVLCLMGTMGLLIRSHYQVADLPQLAGIAIIFLAAVRALDRPIGAGWLLGVGACLVLFSRGWAHGLPYILFLLMGSATHYSLRFCLTKRLLRGAIIFFTVALAWLYWLTSSADGQLWLKGWMEWNVHEYLWLDSNESFDLDALVKSIKTFAWYLWPILPMSGWTLYHFRHKLNEPALRLTVGASLAGIATVIITNPTKEPSFIAAVPALCTMAAIGLASMKRGLIGFIDWFAVLCFSAIAIVVWLGWSAVLFGWPEKTAANIEKLSPGYIPATPGVELVIAILASLAWIWLITWRTRANTSKKGALWRPMILSSGGITLVWLLVMTLYVERLDFAKSFFIPAQEARATILSSSDREALKPDTNLCVADYNLEMSIRAAVEYHLRLPMKVYAANSCEYLLLQADIRDDLSNLANFYNSHNANQWQQLWVGRRSSDRHERLILLRHLPAPATR